LDPNSVIPVLARRSASARRRANGNPGICLTKRYGFLLEFIPVKTGAGMTTKNFIVDGRRAFDEI